VLLLPCSGANSGACAALPVRPELSMDSSRGMRKLGERGLTPIHALECCGCGCGPAMSLRRMWERRRNARRPEQEHTTSPDYSPSSSGDEPWSTHPLAASADERDLPVRFPPRQGSRGEGANNSSHKECDDGGFVCPGYRSAPSPRATRDCCFYCLAPGETLRERFIYGNAGRGGVSHDVVCGACGRSQL
jgi:hypothetical protein